MENKNYSSLLDAFRDLNSISDEEVLSPKVKKFISEAKEFNLGAGVEELNQAKDFLHETEEDQIEVIDVDADSVEHVKDKIEYIGQVIIQCTKCHANRFIDMEDLESYEDDPSIYNVEDECSNCHSRESGFELIGQVGKVAKEEPVEEPKLDNSDQEHAEVKFENEFQDEAEEESEEEEVETAAEADTKTAADELDFEAEEESDGMETTASEDEDDDLELPELGDEFDPDKVRKDDTEEESEDEEDEEKVKEELKPEKAEKEFIPIRRKLRLPTKEALEKLSKERFKLTEEVITKISSPDKIKKVIVESNNKKVYEGVMEELPEEIFNSNIKGFNVGNGFLTCNVDPQEEQTTIPLAKVLNNFNDINTIKIIVWDANTNNELFQGSKEEAIRLFGHCQLISLDAPRVLVLTVKDVDTCAGDECQVDVETPEEKLCDRIFTMNDLAKYNTEDQRSEEFWITESIYAKEDLKIVFDRYVKNTTESLVEEFKRVTGYKDELDEMCEKHNVTVTPVKANEAFNKNNFEDFLYFASRLGLNTLKDVQRFAKEHGDVTDDELLAALKNAVAERTSNVTTNESKIVSFKTRRGLSEALSKFKDSNTKVDYKVKRSKTEGYRYDLILELEEDFAENTGDDFKDKMGFLTNDELEAIAGYKEVIEFFKEKGIDEDKIMDRLLELQADEEEHLEELKELYTAITGEEMVELPEEESEESEEETNEDNFNMAEPEEFINECIENEPELELEIDPSTIAPTDETLTETVNENKIYIDIYAEGAEWEAIKKHLIEEEKVPEVLYYGGLPVIVGVNPGVETLPNGDPGYPDETIEGTSDWEYKYNIKQDDFILFVEKNYDVNNFTLKDLKEIDRNKFESFLKDLYLEEAKEDAWDNYVSEDPDYDRSYFEEVEFDAEAFDADLSEYFKEAYESIVEYKSNSGVVDKKGNIMLEGVIKLEDVESNVTFTLTPLNAAVTESLDSTMLQEQINKQEYKVTNNLSEEVFTFDFTREK